MGDIPISAFHPQLFQFGSLPIWSLFRIPVFQLGSFWGRIFHFGPRQQILDPCLLLASGLRDYEIKLDRRISAARESLQLFLFGN